MFKGAKKYGAGDFERIIEGNGGRSNAYTTFDSTVYYENLPSLMLKKIIDVEADRMNNLLLEEKSFESERLVVLEERKMRYENSPTGKLFLKMMQTVFKGTPYGGSVIGDVKDLKSLNRVQLMKFFKTFYTPNNAIVVITGDVDAEKVYREIKKKFGKIKASDDLNNLKKELDAGGNYKLKPLKGREYHLHSSSPNPIFIAAYQGEPLGTRKAFVFDLLSSMLGLGASSYLTQKYVERKNPIFSNIYVSNYNLKNSGVFFIKGDLLKGTSLSRVRRMLKKDIKKFCKGEALNPRALQKTKNQYLISYYSDIDTNAGLASFLGLRETFFGDYRYYKKELEIYESITLKEIVDTCKKVFVSGEHALFTVWNKNPR